MTKITGHTLIEWGFKPGPHFPALIRQAQILWDTGYRDESIKKNIASMQPEEPETIPLKSLSEGANGFEVHLGYQDTDSRKNYDAVMLTMAEVMRTPVAEKGAVMPDACPAGPMGTIPVGGIVSSKYLHPGWHSADICCSMMMSVFPKSAHVEPKRLLDAVHSTTHFGGGGRDGLRYPLVKSRDADNVLYEFGGDRFLHDLQTVGHEHMGTQGDGNHFAFVGHLRSSGQVCLITHHGSRKPGALLYKKGMKLAVEQTRKVCPEVAKQNAWIVDEQDMWDYWKSLQIVRKWTKANHAVIHKMAAETAGYRGYESFWNEHNFVFRKDDGLFYHAKGATPTFDHYSDCVGPRIIPMSMADPILLVEHSPERPASALGFAPHGAGRNFSRGEHRRRANVSAKEQVRRETEGLDIRFWTGAADSSELPSAYKSGDVIRKEIHDRRLARIIDFVDPYGSIMAGERKTRGR